MIAKSSICRGATAATRRFEAGLKQKAEICAEISKSRSVRLLEAMVALALDRSTYLS